MKEKRIEVKNKIINHLMVSGKKETGEKILLKSLKEIQKDSKKQSQELVKLGIMYSTPTFKLHRIENKKQKKRNKKAREIPAFISDKKARISLAIKFILATLKKKKSSNFHIKLKQELLANAQYKGSAIQIKNELQKQVLMNKHFFAYYRWR
jgi:ribosomal protein S7